MAKKRKLSGFDKELFEDVQDKYDLNNTDGLTGDICEFIRDNFKKYSKRYGSHYDSKKTIRKMFFEDLTYTLPSVVSWIIRNGFRQNMNSDTRKIKAAIYDQFTNEKTGAKYVNYLCKKYENDDTENIANFQFLPIILSDIIREETKKNNKTDKDNQFNTDYLYDACALLTKSLTKKLRKKGVSDDAAFDIACAIPSKELFGAFGKGTGRYEAGILINLLYTLAKKGEDVPVDKIFGTLVDDEYEVDIIYYALRERKDKFSSFDTKQKSVYSEINEWIFNKLEKYDKDLIYSILKEYINDRKKDDRNNRDTNRRYFISSLPESDYKRINKVVHKLLKEDENNKKYL